MYLPNNIRQKIMAKLEETDRIVLIRSKKSGGLRVHTLEKYLQHKALMRGIIQQHKPWVKRQKPMLGPIGSKSLGAPEHLSRESIYEG